MAQGTEADEVRRQGAQPKIERQTPSTAVASPSGAQVSADASAQPQVDVVAMVSRDKNGNPAQSDNFIVVGCSDDDPDHVKDAAWNRAGEAQGAQNFDADKHGRSVEDPMSREERARVEADELYRLNFPMAGPRKS